MSVFDFTQVFEKIGWLYTKRLRRTLETQVDLDGRRFVRPKPATLLQRERLLSGTTSESRRRMFKALGLTKGITLKGTARTKARKHKSTPITRLYVTHDLAVRGFRHDARPDMLRVYVRDVPHIPFYGSTPTLSKIIQWNSKGQPNLNPKVGSNAPHVWPENDAAVMRVQPEWGMAVDMFERDAIKQARAKFVAQIQAEIRL